MDLIKAIENWADERGLTDYSPKQAMKLNEEVGELYEGILKERPDQIKDSIGDIQVVLIILAKQLDIDYQSALQSAWEVISDRKGKTVNGTFIKEEDLND